MSNEQKAVEAAIAVIFTISAVMLAAHLMGH